MKIKTSKLLLTAMLIFVLSIAIFVPVSFAANETHTTNCERLVKSYSYSDAIAYINDGKTDTYPTKEGYIFAGWYTDEACTEGYWGQEKPGENVYALFVPSHVLSVKAQVSANLVNTNTNDDESASIRFVTTVDTLLYTQTGFEISYTVDGTVKNAVKSSNVVYQRLYAVKEGDSSSSDVYEENGKVYTPQDSFCNLSTYFKACTVKNIPAEKFTTKFTIKPFWVTLDGSKVYGETAVKAITDYFSKTDVYVETTGADTVKNGSQEKPFKTLEYALGMVADGGTIHIVDSYTAPSTFAWEEHGKSVTITGGPIDFTALPVEVRTEEPKINASVLHIGDSVTFNNIELGFATGAYVFAQGHTLEMAEKVTFSENITLYGGAYMKEIIGDTNLILKSGEYTTIYGGGFGGKVTGNTNITLSGVVNESADYTSHESSAAKGSRRLFGGGYAAPVNGDTNIKVQSSTVEFNYIFGGGHYNAVNGDTHIEYAGSAMSLYGGGLNGTVNGNTYITMTDGWAHQIFGGCNGKSMTGNTNIDVQGGTVQRRVYGGCYNESKNGTWTGYYVNGYATVSISKDAQIDLDYSLGDNSLVSISRTNSVSEEEKGVFIFNDYKNNSYVSEIGRDTAASLAGVVAHSYNYLVKAEVEGTVSADGDYLIITPNEGKATKVMINNTLMHYAEGKTAYKLPTLASSTDKMEILVTFGDVDTSVDKSAYETSIEGAYYTSLEEAVEAAKVLSTVEQAVTVTLLKNVEVETTMNIADTSNVTVQSEGANQYTINRATALISADGEIFNVSDGNTLTVKNIVLDGRTALEVGSENADHSATLIYNEGTTTVENVTAQYSTSAAIQTKGSAATLDLDTVTINSPGGNGLTLSSGIVYATDVTVENTTDVAIGVGANATFYMDNVALTNIGSGTGHHGICNYGGTIYTADDAEQALTVQTVQGHALANLDDGTVIMNGVTIQGVEGAERNAVYSEGGAIVLANATITDTTRDGIYLNAGTITAVDTTIQDVTRGGITVAGTGKAIAKAVTVKKSLATDSSTYAIYSYGANATAELVDVIIEDAKTAGVFAEKGTVFCDGLTITRGAKGVYSSEGTLGTEEIPMKDVTIQSTTGHGVHSVKGTTYFDELDVLNVNGKGVAIQGGAATIKNATINGAGTTSSKQSGVFAGASSGAANVTLDNVTVLNTTLYGLEVNASNVTVNKNGISIDSVAQHGIANLSSGTIEAQKVTIGETVMSGVYTKASTTNIYSGTIIGSGEDGVHAVSGTSILKNVTISNATIAGIHSASGSTVQTENVTVTGGPVGIESTGGTVKKVEDVDSGVTISSITEYAIKNTSGTSTVEDVKVSSGENGIGCVTGTLNAKNVDIAVTTYGIEMSDGTLSADDVVITGGLRGIYGVAGTVESATDSYGVTITGATYGIHNASGTFTVKDVSVSGGTYGLRNDGGQLSVANTQILSSGQNGIYNTSGTLTLDNVIVKDITKAGTNAHGVLISGGTVNISSDNNTANGLTVNNADGHGIAVTGGTLSGGPISVIDCARYGVYSTKGIDITDVTITNCKIAVGVKNATVTINGVSKTAGNTTVSYNMSDFTSN